MLRYAGKGRKLSTLGGFVQPPWSITRSMLAGPLCSLTLSKQFDSCCWIQNKNLPKKSNQPAKLTRWTAVDCSGILTVY